MKEFLYKLPYYISFALSGVAGVSVLNVMKPEYGSPWHVIAGIATFFMSLFLINSVLLNGIIFRKQVKQNTPIFEFDETSGTIGFPNETKRDILWSKVRKIEIVTTDKGPWEEDVWWLFFLDGVEEPVDIPQGAKGNEKIFDVLENYFENVNMKEIQKAMGSTSNAKFDVWQRNS